VSAPPDPWDADLAKAYSAVEGLGVLLARWQARAEPDADARRCASGAVAAIDTALAALHRIRARLIDETRRADDQALARADELLARARAREGPPGRDAQSGPAAQLSRPLPARSSPPRQGPDAARLRHGALGGGEPR
jgi:hypothetical protein